MHVVFKIIIELEWVLSDEHTNLFTMQYMRHFYCCTQQISPICLMNRHEFANMFEALELSHILIQVNRQLKYLG